MAKTIEQYFHDWEGVTFGYGYGTGEPHTVSALNAFMGAIPADGNYDYHTLERVVGPTVAWLLINTLCRADIIEYGTSPRFGWLTPQGKALKAYLANKTDEEAMAPIEQEHGYVECFPDYCNCEGERCHNPFWVERPVKGVSE